MSAYATQTNLPGVNDQFSHLPKLQRDIMRFIIDQPPRDEGVHVGLIAKAILGRSDPENAPKIWYGHNFT